MVVETSTLIFWIIYGIMSAISLAATTHSIVMPSVVGGRNDNIRKVIHSLGTAISNAINAGALDKQKMLQMLKQKDYNNLATYVMSSPFTTLSKAGIEARIKEIDDYDVKVTQLAEDVDNFNRKYGNLGQNQSSSGSKADEAKIEEAKREKQQLDTRQSELEKRGQEILDNKINTGINYDTGLARASAKKDAADNNVQQLIQGGLLQNG